MTRPKPQPDPGSPVVVADAHPVPDTIDYWFRSWRDVVSSSFTLPVRVSDQALTGDAFDILRNVLAELASPDPASLKASPIEARVGSRVPPGADPDIELLDEDNMVLDVKVEPGLELWHRLDDDLPTILGGTTDSDDTHAGRTFARWNLRLNSD